MLITDVYQQYRLMPNLQQHMLKVAGVAQLILDNIEVTVDKEAVVTACLLHDAGNVIKFDLTKFPEFLEPEGLAFWQNIQDEFRKEFGDDEHLASEEIARQIGASQRVIGLINSVDFNKGRENMTSSDWETKICAYSDMRVSPFGVVPLEQRLAELEARYGEKYPGGENQAARKLFEEYMKQIEAQIFSQTKITPDQITARAVNDTIEALKEIEVG